MLPRKSRKLKVIQIYQTFYKGEGIQFYKFQKKFITLKATNDWTLSKQGSRLWADLDVKLLHESDSYITVQHTNRSHLSCQWVVKKVPGVSNTKTLYCRIRHYLLKWSDLHCRSEIRWKLTEKNSEDKPESSEIQERWIEWKSRPLSTSLKASGNTMRIYY